MSFRSAEYNHVTGTGFRVLELVDYLCKQQRKRTGALYCTPSQEYMAERLGVVKETISRTVSDLVRLGFLVVQPRRCVAGKWKTNMYRLASWEFRPVARMVRAMFTRKKKPTLTKPVLFASCDTPPKIEQAEGVGREAGARMLRELRESLAVRVPA